MKIEKGQNQNVRENILPIPNKSYISHNSTKGTLTGVFQTPDSSAGHTLYDFSLFFLLAQQLILVSSQISASLGVVCCAEDRAQRTDHLLPNNISEILISRLVLLHS